MSGSASSGVSYGNCGGLWFLTICCKCVNGCLIWRRVIDFIWLRRTVLSVEMLEDKHDQHQTLTAAVLARDTARASELMRQHLLTPIPIIQQAMAGN